MVSYDRLALEKHKQLRGKISVKLKDTLDTEEKLSMYYTPGVGAVSEYLGKHPEDTPAYTWTNNNVAIVSDGSAVLGLGDLGPYAALPVMEGKSMLFKHFGDIDAVPIVLDVHSADEIVAAVKAIAPSFGGINLEDIAAPKCFEIEERLKNELSIPVMHDDQHGTAVVVLAGLINATRVTGRKLSESSVVIAGAGAAGIAIAKLLYEYAHIRIIAVDSRGIISRDRSDLNQEKRALLKITNPGNTAGTLADALRGADIFIGVSGPGLLTGQMIRSMSPAPIIFALANPTPEILPAAAAAAGAAVIATGRSDFPNQVNNALAFPGIFRGALDNHIQAITDRHKVAAAEALAAMVKQPDPQHVIPSIFEPGLTQNLARIFVS